MAVQGPISYVAALKKLSTADERIAKMKQDATAMGAQLMRSGATVGAGGLIGYMEGRYPARFDPEQGGTDVKLLGAAIGFTVALTTEGKTAEIARAEADTALAILAYQRMKRMGAEHAQRAAQK